MTDPAADAPRNAPRTRRLAMGALLLAATLALGAAARLARPPETRVRTGHAGDEIVALEAHLDRSSVLQNGDGLVRVELVLRGRDAAQRPGVGLAPTDLVVVLDRSGSMEGQPLETAKGAVRELVSQLAAGDRFALVSYASDASVDVRLEAVGAESRARWLARIDVLAAGGGTHMAGGLDAAHALVAAEQRAGRAPRVIVLSDGLANQGDYSLDGLRARAGRARGGEYVLSSVGIGGGFDETVMSALADAGAGNFYYLPDFERLAGVFRDEFAAARETIARGLAVRVAPAGGARLESASGYPLASAGDGALAFRPGDLFAGQERRVWLTFRAPTGSAGEVALGALSVEFTTLGGETRRVALAELPRVACVADDDAYYASFDAGAYNRANVTDALGALKQRVARKVAEGRQDEALAEVEAWRAKSSAEQERALGSVSADEMRELDALADAVASPAAARPEERNRLGKSLLESGRDAQRAGAKR